MAEQAEQAFVRTFVNTLSTQPVIYGDDYQQQPDNWLKKVPILPIQVPALPERKEADSATTSRASISIVFKSAKPSASYTLAVQPTDTIASIKAQLASEPTAPPADAQRLLLKGKALADNKLLKEYTVKDGDTVNLMVKPGFDWDPSKPVERVSSPSPSSSSMASASTGLSTPARPSGRHHRIPSVVLSPSPSSESPGAVEKDIVLTLDSATVPTGVAPEMLSTFHAVVSKPEFWEHLHAFLKGEFTSEGDALTAWEDFFRASKGSLTASQIAKIRDQVGVVGMAGT